MNNTDFSPLAGPYRRQPRRINWTGIATWATYVVAIAVVAWRVMDGGI